MRAAREIMPITFVVGLPGSGKSTWIEQQAQGTDALVIHDFKARSHNDDPAFHSSRHLPELIAAVESGRNSFIADIDFCRTASRNEAAAFLARAFPGVKVQWVFFEKNVAACQANARRDIDRRAQDRLAKIAEFGPQYQIPEGVILVPVWSPHKHGA